MRGNHGKNFSVLIITVIKSVIMVITSISSKPQVITNALLAVSMTQMYPENTFLPDDTVLNIFKWVITVITGISEVITDNLPKF